MSVPVVIGNATLWNRDCIEAAGIGLIPLGCAVVSDPPYGIGYRHGGGGSGVNHPNGTRSMSFKRHAELIRGDSEAFSPEHLLGRPCLLFGGNHFYSRLPDGGTFHVWDKHCGKGCEDDFSDAEFFWTSWRCKSHVFRYLWKGVLQDGEKGERRYHPSQKPIALMGFCIGLTKAPVICDPYMGAGSTGLAALRAGRQFIGFEIDPRHFATACERIAREVAQPRLFEAPAARPEQHGLFAGAAA